MIDYKSDEDYSSDLKSLSSNQDYTIKLPPDKGGWVRTVNYDKKNKTYIVEAVARIIYVNYEWVANEIAYVKKVCGNYKIEKIITNTTKSEGLRCHTKIEILQDINIVGASES